MSKSHNITEPGEWGTTEKHGRGRTLRVVQRAADCWRILLQGRMSPQRPVRVIVDSSARQMRASSIAPFF